MAGAKKAYEDSIAVARDRGDKSGQALAQQNLAAVLYSMGDSRQGGAGYSGSPSSWRMKLETSELKSLALNNLCMASLQGGELDTSTKSCEESLRMRSEMGDDRAPGEVARSISETC